MDQLDTIAFRVAGVGGGYIGEKVTRHRLGESALACRSQMFPVWRVMLLFLLLWM
jgi:hypothetical protein